MLRFVGWHGISLSFRRGERPAASAGSGRRMIFHLSCALLCVFATVPAFASTLKGQVTFNGLPVPGVTVEITQNTRNCMTITDAQGNYTFPDLTDGSWTLHITMTGFTPATQTIVVGNGTPSASTSLKILPLGAIEAQADASVSLNPAVSAPSTLAVATTTPDTGKETAPAPPGSDDDELRQRSADGLLINGSVNNSESSPFALSPVFGNDRFGQGQYYGSAGAIVSNSALDARPYSITGLNTPRPQFSDITGVLNFGGPLRVRHMVQKDPRFFVGYEWTRNHEDNTQSSFVPTASERAGDFSHSVNADGQPITIADPATGQPFPDNMIPADRISPQAQALLAFYPLPTLGTTTLYNGQVPLVSDQHQDAVQARVDQSFGFRDQLNGRFALQSTRSSSPNLFSFIDTTGLLGMNARLQWSHRFGQRFFLYGGYQFSRMRIRVMPWFADRSNVSGLAGVTGNDQAPADWGPPSLSFSSGIAGLTDQNSADTRTETNAPSLSLLWIRGRHNVAMGSDFRREEFNYRSQQDPRGSFGFTGAATEAPGATGSDFADFLLGIPDTSSIAYGNADKYFRESLYDEYITDDWRLTPEFTVNAGVRWEYGAPITELFDRIVNLDIAPGFANVAPLVASHPIGPLSGVHYPDSLIEPDRNGIEPRIGIAWRPIGGSSLVVRLGYGIYRDTSVYQGIVTQMAQQAPLSHSLRIENSTACPLSLANGFPDCGDSTPQTFAVDPQFRLGYAQNWQLSVQKDLPASLQMNITYLGTKGTHGMQEFLPNTYPSGAANPCPACPVGFTYLISGGNLSREAGRVQLRRRLHDGLAGSLQYTWSKSIDDDSFVGGQGPVSSQSAAPGEFPTASVSSADANASATIAQDWRNLASERGLSAFDQRNTLTAQLQYTSGMGLKGGTLLGGWRAGLLKNWTFQTDITAGSGLPETPLLVEAVPGTGVTNTIRPNRTSSPLYAGSGRRFLNKAGYSTPPPGKWGNAGRNSIIGPNQLSLDASMARTFRLNGKLSLDARIDSTNAVNRVNYSAWNTTVTSPQFGLPTAANAMRMLQTTFRLRF